jgi:primosomal protein N' (replication factor Y)
MIEDLQRSFGDRVGTLEEERAIAVGTERDLPQVSNVAVAVSVDADSAILAPHYRAGEEALRLLARLAAVVAPGRGHRCMVQTGLPDHPVIEAFRTGRPFPFMDRVLEERERTGLPPVGELIAIEVTGGDDADRALREVVSGREDLHGPAAVGDGQRWIVQGADLRSVRLRLRSVVQSLRDGGARVRVDADPVDL